MSRDENDWDAQAATFDDEPDHGLRDPATREAWRALLRRHLPAAPSDVVDLGCGTGTLSLLLAEGGHRVRGVDSSPAMVAAARVKTSAHEVEVVVGDAADPPYDAGSVDVVLCRHVLWALPEPPAVLGRWVRLLRPGGSLLLVEGRWHTGGGLAAEETDRLVREHLAQVQLERLDDPVLWGGPISDERYLVVAREPRPA